MLVLNSYFVACILILIDFHKNVPKSLLESRSRFRSWMENRELFIWYSAEKKSLPYKGPISDLIRLLDYC